MQRQFGFRRSQTQNRSQKPQPKTMKSHIQNLFLSLALCAGACPVAAQNFVISSSPGVGSGPTSVCAADVNGDGRLDLICANNNPGANTLTVDRKSTRLNSS